MAEKSFKSRIIHKHDIAENWEKATSFIPQQGEIIVYDIDENYNYERMKIGDGVTNVNELPFADNAVNEKIDAVGALVGDTSVANQINEALLNNQADWAQNDETAADYIKNRTHWEEKVSKPYVIAQDLKLRAIDDGYYADVKNSRGFTAGETVTVTYSECVEDYEDITVTGVAYEIAPGSYEVSFEYLADNLLKVQSITQTDETIDVIVTSWFYTKATIILPDVIAEEETVIHHLDPKFIKDMYYETEPMETELVPETTVEFDLENDGDYIEKAIDITLVEGTTYTVNWNGEKYKCVCYLDEDIPVIGNNECWSGGGGNGEPFLVSNYDGLTAINVYESGTYTISISTMQQHIHHVPTKYIKDMYYDNGTTIAELVSSQTVSGFALMGDPMYGVEDPFELLLVKGNTYIVNWDGTEYELKCEYLQGMPAIGNLEFLNDNFDGIPFLVAGNGNFSTILTTSTAESHTISITEIYHDLKQIDIKYLPIMEEAYETVFERNGIVSRSYTTSFNKCIIGMAKVTIDNVSEKVEFVATDGYESWLETDNWFIATYPEGIYFEFPDEEEHSVKIGVLKQIVKEEHLPDSVKAIPDWNQNDETAADYIKNRTHYEIDNSISLSIVDSTGHAQGYTPYKVGPYTWDYHKPLTIQVDGVDYSFDAFINDGRSNAIGYDAYRVGAPYGGGSITDSSEYPFTIIVFLTTEEYAHIAFADGSNNHTVKIPDIELKQLDSKYVGTDWNQNDPNGVGYINNRTHWANITENKYDISKSMSLPFAEGQTCYVYLTNTNSNTTNLYTDNSDYPDGGLPVKKTEDGALYVGDPDLILFPFCIYRGFTERDPAWPSFYSFAYVILVEEEVHKLDPKFIPWPDENDALELVAELGVVEPVAASDGSIYTDKNGVIYAL